MFSPCVNVSGAYKLSVHTIASHEVARVTLQLYARMFLMFPLNALFCKLLILG